MIIASIYAELDGTSEPLNPLVAFQQMAELNKTINEILASKDFAANPANALLKPYDKNNDGKLSADEIMSIPATQHVTPPAKQKQPKKNK